MSVERAIVTGASGFVGARLLANVRGARTIALGVERWREAIEAADFRDATVFHLAARVPARGVSESQFRRDNAEKTRALAQHAARAGARRLVFLSTIKVNGEETHGRAFRFDDPVAPAGAYARSKRAAEEALNEIASETGLDVAVVRAPLVYGRGARGSLRALARLADSSVPLPFAAIDNRRSFIHVDDLARALVAAGTVAQARRATLLVAHRESLSTARVVATMREHLHRSRRLFTASPALLEAAAAIVGASDRMHSLTRSLEVDAAHAEAVLGWRANVAPEDAIADVVGDGAAP